MAVDYPPGCAAGSAGCGFVLRLDRRLLRHSLHGSLPETVVRLQRRRSAVGLASQLLLLGRRSRPTGTRRSPSKTTRITRPILRCIPTRPQPMAGAGQVVPGHSTSDHRGDPCRGEVGRCGTARRLGVSQLGRVDQCLCVGCGGDPRLLWQLSPGLVRPADGSEPVGVSRVGVNDADD